MAQDTDAIDAVLDLAPVIPVLMLDDPEAAIAVGRALVAGGLPALEVTLRTGRALDCIHALAQLEGAVVGAGTILDGGLAKAAADAGARFLVSPGATPKLVADAEACGVPLLPGVATASEAMAMLERGYSRLKFFPAEFVGGAGCLRSLASPLPKVRFCPTGGIDRAKASTYLALPNVACVGGSWVAPTDAIKAREWNKVEVLAKEAALLQRQS
jgi:2-dehydro-3-deoxyphosphogluconate aldolase/(4S)-4-hydroxy-2-oxoglutarate aldolase